MNKTTIKSSNLIVAVIEIVLLTVVSVALFGSTPKSTLVLDYWTSSNADVQLYYDTGKGYSEDNSTHIVALHQDAWKEIKFKLPHGKISHLRLILQQRKVPYY